MNSFSVSAGVEGAIHRAAGPGLLEYCRNLPELYPGVRCPTVESVITPGFNLPSKLVIHAVGPVWHGGKNRKSDLLANCYSNSLLLADDNGLESIAFPAISCGV